MRSRLLFNDDWLYLPGEADPGAPDSAFTPVTLPHANAILPYHNFDTTAYAFVSTYRKHFVLPEPRNGRRVFLDFDGAMIASTVTVNGHTFPEYRGGYTPFSFDITDVVDDEGDNLVSVRLDSTEREDIPPFGGVVDYLTFGGIYRDVHLRLVDSCHVERIFVRPQSVLTAPAAEVDVFLKNDVAEERRVSIAVTIFDPSGQSIAHVEQAAQVAAGKAQTVTIRFPALPGVTLWSPQTPALYTAEVALRDNGHLVDRYRDRFGFREMHFEKDGFTLNGQPLKLIGLNRHQTYPYIGAAAPARLQRRDADILKDELGVNVVRTSHYPQSPHFLDRCDEIGLLVFEEIPGWQHIGDAEWQKLSLRDLTAMIERDRNHPSIILWGVRINESQDDDAFYEDTNTLAHQLDSTRQTGGVRYFQESRFLEDVFTYNDFSNTVVDPLHAPHLITEFSGHMYPTKSFDQEERMVEQALRHARIQDKQLGMSNVAGAIGWCAFDYNTHKQFGSGDRICYHGVSDIFRLPKYAAWFYESQISPDVRPVLRPATVWMRGDRDASVFNPLVIFSNCESVDLFFDDRKIGSYTPDRDAFPNLPHPPYQISLKAEVTWGAGAADLRVVGYRDGAAVAEQWIDGGGLPAALTLRVDDEELIADGADMTRLVFRIVDQYDNRLPFAVQVVSFEIDGPAELIGENPFPLVGGQAALYIRTRKRPGEIVVRARTPYLPQVEVRLRSVAK